MLKQPLRTQYANFPTSTSPDYIIMYIVLSTRIWIVRLTNIQEWIRAVKFDLSKNWL